MKRYERKWTLMGAPLGRVYVSAGPSIGGPGDDGIGVEVEVVPLTDYQGAVDALAELVRLKDGPRDEAYRAAKDAAWDAARAVLARLGEQ
jgi:hypothetical protein